MRSGLDTVSESETAFRPLINQIPVAPGDNIFDELLLLASQICEMPFAAVAMPGKKHSWHKIIPASELLQSDLLTAEDFANNDLFFVSNVAEDPRFCRHPLVCGAPHIRFFATAAIRNTQGHYIGHLGVMSPENASLSQVQLNSLQMLARQAGKLVNLATQVVDLTTLADEARVSEDLMNSIFHNAIDGIVVLDEKGRILQWNPRAEHIFGWSESEVFAKYFHKLVIPDSESEVLSEIRKHYNRKDGETMNASFEIKAHRKNNEEFYITLGISATQLKGLQLFICFISDITERKLATLKLAQQKKFYENILNSLPSDIAVFDANHKYLFVNPGAIKDEVHRQFIVGKDDFEYCEYRNRDMSLARLRREMFLEIKKTGKEIKWEDTVMGPEGKLFTSLRRIFPVYDDNQQLAMVIGYGVDITDRKIMEEKQNSLVKQLSTQNTQLVDFCNIVSHNLRAPLVNMSMLVEYIQESEDDSEKNDLISKLQPVLNNLHATFNELVESIQIKQNQDIKSEYIDFEDCLCRVVTELGMEIKKTDAEIEVKFEEAPGIVYPHKYMYSILHNLVSNAIKYKSPARKPMVKLETMKMGSSIILSVNDNGVGVDLDKHKDNFFKIGKVFHRHPNAKGFGLFMTKTQVDAMGGRIWVESTPDVGSTFFIEFKT